MEGGEDKITDRYGEKMQDVIDTKFIHDLKQFPKSVSWKETDGTPFEGNIIHNSISYEEYEWGKFVKVLEIIRPQYSEEDLVRARYFKRPIDKDKYFLITRVAFVTKITRFKEMFKELFETPV